MSTNPNATNTDPSSGAPPRPAQTPAASNGGAVADYRAFPILYVDDDLANLMSFRYLFEDRFQIFTASHSDEALPLLETGKMAVLLADHRMESGLSGVELCKLARERFPDVVRMIVTAYADIPMLAAGINDGQISRYISKPWIEEAMLAALVASIDAHHMGTFTRELQVRLLKWEQLSTSSFVVGRVLRDLCNPATALQDNLAFSMDALPAVEAALAGAPEAVRQRFRETEEALRDAAAASRTMTERIGHFRNGEGVGVLAGAGTRNSVTDLDWVVQATVSIVTTEARKRATLAVDLGAKPKVAVDPTRASQIVLGLLMNTLNAIPAGAPWEHPLRISTFTSGGGRGGLAIDGVEGQDAGDGDPFEPFQAQAAAGTGGDAADGTTVGRGLGLAVVRELARAAGGDIQLRRSAEGTKLVLELPLG